MTDAYEPAVPDQPAYPQPPHPGYPPYGYLQPGYPQAYGQHPGGYPPPYGYYPQPSPSNGVGTAGFVLGLLGLLLSWIPFFGIALGILGIVFGGLGMQAGRRDGTQAGLAIAGLICGIVSLVPGALIIVAVANSS